LTAYDGAAVAIAAVKAMAMEAEATMTRRSCMVMDGNKASAPA
jgi:hypothetical protein